MLPAQTLLFVCNVSNDAFTILTQQPIAGWHSQRFDSVTAALDAATPGDGLLVSVRGYPHAPTTLSDAEWSRIASLNISAYVEYPAALPGLPPPANATPQRAEFRLRQVGSLGVRRRRRLGRVERGDGVDGAVDPPEPRPPPREHLAVGARRRRRRRGAGV